MPDGTRPPHVPASRARTRMLTIRILATTDLHMHLGAESASGGLARIAPVIAEQRARFDNVLLFDNGDLIEGTPLADELARAGLGAHDIHPAIAALNRLGFDAATLGNHDFAHGTTFLRRALRDATFPITLANAGLTNAPSAWSESLILPRRMRDADGDLHDLSIGVFGVLPPQTVDWEAGLGQDMRTEDVVAAARRAVSSLRARGADVIIALSHGGHGEGPAPRAENAAGVIARIEGVDAVIAGHTHEVIVRAAAPDCAPIVKAGYAGSHLAAITLGLYRTDTWSPSGDSGARPVATASGHALSGLSAFEGGWQVDCQAAEILPAAAAPCPELADTLLNVAPAVIRRLSTPIGHSPIPLASHYALLGVDPGLRLADAAVRAHLAEALPENDLPVLAAFAPFRTGGRGGPENFVSIPAGPLLLSDLSTLYPFTNHAAAIIVSGAEIAEWLERAAAIFTCLPDTGEIRPLIDPGIAGFQFDIITGLQYRINLSRPAAFDAGGRRLCSSGRIEGLRHAGGAVQPRDRFLLITNSYRLSGGPLYAALTEAKRCVLPEEARLRMRNIIAGFVARRTAVPLALSPFFELAARPGSRASLDTSARALAEACPLPAQDAGLTGAGFRRLILSF